MTVKKSPRSRESAGTSVPAFPVSRSVDQHRWTFLTNHSHVLILLHQNPDIVLREAANHIGITERAVQRIVADLEEAGFLTREKQGRQNHYRVNTRLQLRHPIEAHRTIGDLLNLVEIE